MGKYNPDDYETVDSRIKRFYSDHPEGCIHTDLLSDPGDLGTAVVKAYVFTDNGEILRATGLAFEQAGDGYVNKTSHLENCETSAIGRALANFNYSGDKRPSREEMAKTDGPEFHKRNEQANTATSSSPPSLDDKFQLIAANKKLFGDNIGPRMNQALQFRTEGNEQGLDDMIAELGI